MWFLLQIFVEHTEERPLPVVTPVTVFQATSVRGRTCWWMAAAMWTCPARSCTAVTAACPMAAAASTSTACPAACSPARYVGILLLSRCSQLLGSSVAKSASLWGAFSLEGQFLFLEGWGKPPRTIWQAINKALTEFILPTFGRKCWEPCKVFQLQGHCICWREMIAEELLQPVFVL